MRSVKYEIKDYFTQNILNVSIILVLIHISNFQLEEERILSSGRSKIPGVKVRMELAWQKERKEQQRLLEETATLARDLRQTLFEVKNSNFTLNNAKMKIIYLYVNYFLINIID